MNVRDFKLSIYESDLSDVEKEYLTSTMESALAATGFIVMTGVIAGIFSASVSLLKNLSKATKLYEQLHPEVPKWRELVITDKITGVMGNGKVAPDTISSRNPVAKIGKWDVAPYVCIGSTADGKDLFEITYHAFGGMKRDYQIEYKSKDSIGYEHSGYYVACFCSTHDCYFQGLADWTAMTFQQYKNAKKMR